LTIVVASQDEFGRRRRVYRGLRVSKRGLDPDDGSLYRLLQSHWNGDGYIDVVSWPNMGGQSLHPRPVILLVLQIVQRRHFWRASTMSPGQTVRSVRHEAMGQDLRACQRVSAEEMPRLDSKDGVYEKFNRGRQPYHPRFSRVHRLRHRRMPSVLVPGRAEMVLQQRSDGRRP